MPNRPHQAEAKRAADSHIHRTIELAIRAMPYIQQFDTPRQHWRWTLDYGDGEPYSFSMLWYEDPKEAMRAANDAAKLIQRHGRELQQKYCAHPEIKHHPRPVAESDSWDECLVCGADVTGYQPTEEVKG